MVLGQRSERRIARARWALYCSVASEGDLVPVDADRVQPRHVELALADVAVLLHELLERLRLELPRQDSELLERVRAVEVGQARHGLVLGLDDDLDHRLHDLLLAADRRAPLQPLDRHHLDGGGAESGRVAIGVRGADDGAEDEGENDHGADGSEHASLLSDG